MQQGVIEAVSEKTVNTKRGPAQSYGVKINGSWYNNGFKNPGVNKGDQVQFDAKPNAKGYGMDLVFVNKTSSGSGTSGTAGNSWPIAKDDARSRSIIRQSSVKAALEYYALITDSPADPADVISVAMQFEMYCSGELDAAEARELDDMVS